MIGRFLADVHLLHLAEYTVRHESLLNAKHLSGQMKVSSCLAFAATFSVVAKAQQDFRPLCKARSTPIKLEWDPERSQYVPTRSNDPVGRLLEDSPKLRVSQMRSMTFDDEQSARWLVTEPLSIHPETNITEGLNRTAEKPSIWARFCQCNTWSRPFIQASEYCPLHTQYCAMLTGTTAPNLYCLTLQKGRNLATTSFWVIGAGFLIAFGWLFFAPRGHYCLHFFLASSIPYYNNLLAGYLERHHPEVALRMMRRNMRIRQRELLADRGRQRSETLHRDFHFEAHAVTQLSYASHDNTNNVPNEVSNREVIRERPTHLKLSTRVVDQDSTIRTTATPDRDLNDSDREDDDNRFCVICFGALEIGNRVGDLRCGHIFHVNCLKTWCQRRNACPLCQTEVATACQQEDIHLGRKFRSGTVVTAEDLSAD